MSVVRIVKVTCDMCGLGEDFTNTADIYPDRFTKIELSVKEGCRNHDKTYEICATCLPAPGKKPDNRFSFIRFIKDKISKDT